MPAAPLSNARRRAILVTLTLTVGIYVLTVTVANVTLPQLRGAFAATPDQITWVVTANLLATAVATPLSGWLVGRFGRRQVMLWATFWFTLFTLLCGLATSLPELVVWRALQGFSGAPALPVSQAIILGIYPREQHGRVVLLWAMGVTIGSIIAPALGGYASEAFDWRWVFLMVVPAAFLCFVLCRVFVSEEAVRAGPPGFDWAGFLFLAVAVGALQLMLDRGQRLDWFDSPEILAEAVIAAFAFYLFLAHVTTTDRPFLDPRLLTDRNYAVGILLGLVFGMLYFTTLVLQPTMLRDLRDFPESVIGLLQASRGFGVLVGCAALLAVHRWLDPRHALFLGFLAQGAAGFIIAGFDVNMTVAGLYWTTILQGFGIGLMWSPITVVTFATLAPRHVPEAASVFHLLRNIGSSAHISLSAALVVRSGQASYAELAEALNPFNESLRFAAVAGGWDAASTGGLAGLSAEITRQAGMIGYINAHYAYGIAAIAVMPLALLARRPPRPA